MQQFEAVPPDPLAQRGADELRTVVQAQASERTAQFHPLVQRKDHAHRRQTGVDLDPQRFTVEIVIDVEGAETPLGLQGIGHEVRQRGVVRLLVSASQVTTDDWEILFHGLAQA